MTDLQSFAETIRQASASGRGLCISGGNTKRFLGHSRDDLLPLSTAGYRGVMDYHPAELVIRLRAGTRVRELLATLAENHQTLAFEPPDHGPDATIGGVISAGLSGSARPYRGSARDHLLGVGMVLHDGGYCEFGGQVMKNVAGYDVSRLACGAFGTLGLIADVSLKVVPLPAVTITLTQTLAEEPARELVCSLSRRFTTLSASCYQQGRLWLRLSGNELAVKKDRADLGGEVSGNDVWAQIDTQATDSLQQATELWRLSTHADEKLAGRAFTMMDWGFCQRWLADPADDPRLEYKGQGHWTRFRAGNAGIAAGAFHPLTAAAHGLHKRLKATFDPRGIFNPGRMYPEVDL